MRTFSVYYGHNEDGSRSGKIIVVQRASRKKPAQVIAILTNEERYALIGELFNPVDTRVNGDSVK